ncbi:MAG: HAMP domain-containing sensor histidine kinase [Chitinophagaceae bacterium]
MKLFTKYSRNIIAVTISIFLVASFAFYFTLKYVQLQQMDSDLEIEEEEIQLYIHKLGHLPTMMRVEDQFIQFTPVPERYTQRHFQKTEIHEKDGSDEDYRQLVFGVEAQGKWYKVTVSKSMEETDHLIKATFGITAITICCILISLLLINRFVLKKLWNPFYKALDVVKQFKVNQDDALEFPTTNTEEFSVMIRTLEDTTQQAKVDYLALKTFSENASHEIQTPIAIIRSKIDLLIQDEKLTEKQDNILQSVLSAIQRLSRLNSSLLLLARIENNQYADAERIDLQQRAEKKIAAFQELWQMKNIQVNADLRPAEISMNKELADILLNNLFSNATKHNVENGKIDISLREGRLTVSNTSDEPPLDPARIFQRFYKPTQTKQNNGLGLSIIRQICEAFGLAVEYQRINDLHSFTISWNKP